MKILDTCFGNGARFLEYWADWRVAPQPSQTLHYVGIVHSQPSFDGWRSALSAQQSVSLYDLAAQLADQCWGLLPGFHRLAFEEGRVLLTLCVGDLQTQLKVLRFEADAVNLSLPATTASPDEKDLTLWDVKTLTHCCRRGTQINCEGASKSLLGHLRQCGFRMQPPDGSRRAVGLYSPDWEPKRSTTLVARAPGQAVVLGAGLAGASAAASLARRGWTVTVLDEHAHPAHGASGLPVGLMSPHATVDDDARSRLSRCGLRMTLQQAERLLVKGLDWNDSGVLERRFERSNGLPASWPQEGFIWSHPAQQGDGRRLAGVPDDDKAMWHSRGAWVKPAKLVNAWLAQPGICFEGNSHVANLRQHNGQWHLFDAANRKLAYADLVVIANARGAVPLLQDLSKDVPDKSNLANLAALLQTVEGQVSWSVQSIADASDLPPFPVNGLGSLIGHVPLEGTTAWFTGATFEREGEIMDVADGHLANLHRLNQLHPASGQLFAHQLQAHQMRSWRNTRCTTVDRMPLCGPLGVGDSQDLWITSGFGARGLSLTFLCAELLAARISGEPWPIDAKLAQSMDSMRKTG